MLLHLILRYNPRHLDRKSQIWLSPKWSRAIEKALAGAVEEHTSEFFFSYFARRCHFPKGYVDEANPSAIEQRAARVAVRVRQMRARCKARDMGFRRHGVLSRMGDGAINEPVEW